MPLRLINVLPRLERYGQVDSNLLRLDCETAVLDEKYVALSHLWGRPQSNGRLCLNRRDLARWMNCLDLRTLPKTFQDAVQVTRDLGIRYLWIDTLCIVQDDMEDLQTQIQHMEDVFRCAYVTISATCASGSADGFLKRTCKGTQYPPLFFASKTDRLGSLYLREPIDDFKRDVEESALSRRGWIFQERALSPRIIHFTEVQVYWECGEGVRCETLKKLYK